MRKFLLVLLLISSPVAAGLFGLSGGVVSAEHRTGLRQPPPQEGFVPVDQLPGQEQLPATPLVAAAYGVAWAAVLLYVWFLWRRLARVERELADVARRIESGGRR